MRTIPPRNSSSLAAAIAQCLAAPVSGQQKVEALVAAANQAGGPDNVTAVLMQFEKAEEHG